VADYDPRPPEPGFTARGGEQLAEERSGISRILPLFYFCFAALAVALRPLYCSEAVGISTNLLIYGLILACLSLWLLHQALHGELLIQKSGLELPLGLFAAFVFLSIRTASAPHFALLKAVEFLAVLLLFFFLAQTLKTGQGWIIIHLILAAGLMVVLYGFYQERVEIPALLQLPKEELLAQFNLPPERWDELYSRIASGEVFATFALSNSFAGFLVLLIPLALGLFLDALFPKSRRGIWAACGYGIMLLFMLWGLRISRSDGGYLAFGVSVILFAAIIARKFLRRRWPIILLALVILCVLGALLFATTSKGKTILIRGKNSLEIRAGFWHGALEVIKHNPLLGVGLANFEPHYLRYKLPWSMETKAAHNDYLQIWAELGIFALVSYILFWTLLLKKGAMGMFQACAPAQEHSKAERKRSDPATGQPSFHMNGFSFGLIIGLISLLISHFLFERSLGHWTLAFIFPWALFWILTVPGRQEVESQGKFWRLGLFVGLATFLFRGLLDMDLFVPGVAEMALVLAAVFLASSEGRKATRHRLAWSHKVGLAALALLVFVLPIRFVLFPLSKAEVLIEKGVTAARNRHEREAIELWESAASISPSDPAPHHWLASLYAAKYRSAPVQEREALPKAIKEYKLAIYQSPLEGIRYFYLGELYLDAVQSDKKYLPLAEKTLKNTVELYPTRPDFRLFLARALEMEGNLAEALEEYRSALKFALGARQKERRLADKQEEMERKIKELEEKINHESTEGTETLKKD
jgi:tetratricopeptide (TPR) repeat protein